MYDNLDFDPFAVDFEFNESVQPAQPVKPVQQVQQTPQVQAQPVKPVSLNQPVQQVQVKQSQSQVVRPVQPMQTVQAVTTQSVQPQPMVQPVQQVSEADMSGQGTTVFGSRTNKESVGSFERIATKNIEWKSSIASFYYYDSEAKEIKQVDPNLEFIPLTATMSINGTHQVGKKGTQGLHYNRVYSNEFTNYNSDFIVVREKDNFNGTTEDIAQGTYTKDIKPIISELPYANFTINIYCLVRGTDEIVKFMFSKSSRDIGFDISKNRMIGQCFKLDAYEEAGSAIKYNIPVLSFGRISLEEDAKATELATDIEKKLASRNKAFVGSLMKQQPIQPVQPQQVQLSPEQVDFYNSGYEDFGY